ncbi:sensor histidine kinase [Acinetobacter ihumii]|uniref:sensor histidine kinase n=1 Tax=Acinetobacter ihumii TaxID=2483802 RepID=UPI001D17E2EF|nr:HAMP domain-containing sensor histidine kinase [Acinetobacter ihumii]
MSNWIMKLWHVYRRQSLSTRMSWSVTIFSILLLVLIGISAYRIALEESQEVIDRQMQEMANFLDKNNLSNRLSNFDPTEKYDETDIFIDIVPREGLKQLSRQHNYILPYAQSAHFSQHKTSRGELKIYVLPLPDKQIQISQLIKVRRHLAEELAFSMLIPYIFFMPFAVFGVYRLIRHHLRSLHELSTAFAQRDYHDLSEIKIKDLPLEITPAINELNDLFQRIQKAQQQQQIFVANAAHELRTPLTALNLQSALLLKTSRHSHAYQENLTDLENSLQRMTHLVEQLMSLAHQEIQQNEPLQVLNLVDYTRRSLSQLLASTTKKQIQLHVDIQQQNEYLYVMATSHTLESILINLMDNAIKYSPEHGELLIKLYQTEHHGVIEIHDSGPGIAYEQHQQVLQRFVRLEATQHLASGSGLGLSIVQSALNMINARMRMEASERLRGLKVTVEFNQVER